MKGKVKKSICVMLAFFLMAASLIILPSTPIYAADEFDMVRNKWKDLLTGGAALNTSDPDIAARIRAITSTAQAYWDSMDKSSGRTMLWSDLDFSKSNEITATYSRLRSMALAYNTFGSTLKGDTALKTDIINGLDWMYTNRYNENTTKYDNWYDWMIGTPNHLNDVTVLMYDALTPTQVNNYMAALIKHSYRVGNTTSNENVGANRADRCRIRVLYGVIKKDSAKINEGSMDMDHATYSVLREMQESDNFNEGFYADGSFLQHVEYPYNGNYGRDTLRSVADVVHLLQGSSWAWNTTNQPRMDNIFKRVYDSFEPLIYKGGMMSMVRGRIISFEDRSEHKDDVKVLESIIKLIDIAPVSDAAAYKKMVKYWIESDTVQDFYSMTTPAIITKVKAFIASTPSRGELYKNMQYNNMDRAVHLRQGFGFGIAMHSTRIGNAESINGNNNKGYHTADGMTYLYNNDLSQYDDGFWPTANWNRYAGITVESGTTVAANANSDRNWVGGTEILGSYGVTGMDLHPYGRTLQAKKSWFMFDDEVVALGAGITGAGGKSIESVVEHRKLNSAGNNALTVNGASKSNVLGWSEDMTGVYWAHLAGSVPDSDIGYYFPGGTALTGLRESRSGSYRTIDNSGSTTTYTRNYLSLYFKHGIDPANGSYAYVLFPGKTPSQVSSYAANPNITILQNDSTIQAVKENTLNIIGANFWIDSTNTVDIITCDKKAAVMTKENSGSEIEVSVVDPTQANSGTISLMLNKSAASVVSKDPRITVTQLSPQIKLSIDVNGADGAKIKAKFTLGSGGATPTPTPSPTPTLTPTPIPGETNLALNKAVTCSGQSSSTEASKAVDGDSTTRWSAYPHPQWINVDLGAVYNINKTELLPYQNRAYQYKIEVSTDGAQYALLLDKTGNTSGGVVITDSFETVNARFVKLTVTGCSGYTGGWASISEFRVFKSP